MCVCVSLREKKPLAALNEEGRVKSSTPKKKIKQKTPSGGGGVVFVFRVGFASPWKLRGSARSSLAGNCHAVTAPTGPVCLLLVLALALALRGVVGFRNAGCLALAAALASVAGGAQIALIPASPAAAACSQHRQALRCPRQRLSLQRRCHHRHPHGGAAGVVVVAAAAAVVVVVGVVVVVVVVVAIVVVVG